MLSDKNIQVVKPDSSRLSRPVYVLGNSELLNTRCVSVAGTRKIDTESSAWLDNILSQVHIPIVSGLALGTDTIAHECALKYGVPTIAILPSGFNQITPKINRKLARKIVANGGALVSEYPANQGIKHFSQYHDRNELIAEMGIMLIVPQFDKESGTRSTVDYTNSLRKVIVVQDTQKYSGNRYIMESEDYFTLPK